MSLNRLQNQSGQSILLILLMAAGLMTTLMLSTSGLLNDTRTVKTSQLTVENDMFSTAVFQVINSAGSCSEVISKGDGGTPIPYLVDATHPPGVYEFLTGLNFTNGTVTTPFLTYASQVNSLKIVQPSVTLPGSFRLDPTGYVDYRGPQPASLQNPFVGTNCHLINLHVVTQNPTTAYGLTTQNFDFPLYIGELGGVITACQGASAGVPCVVNPAPALSHITNPSCIALSSTTSYTWTQVGTSYVVIQPITPAGPPITVAAPPVTLTIGSAPPGGAYIYNITPYGSDGVQGATTTFKVLTNAPATMVSETPGAGTIAWVADANTTQVLVSPPGVLLNPTGSEAATPGTYTFTPQNSCGTSGAPATQSYP